MSDPTFRSFAVRAHTTENPHLAQKPSGLTVGDRIVIFVNTYYGVASGAPSGFDLVHNSGSLANMYTKVYSKIADASDVAASNFSIANADSRWVASGVYAIAGGSDIGFAGSVNGAGAGNNLRQFAVDDYAPPTDGVVLWDVWSDSIYSSYYTINATETPATYDDLPYGRTDSAADWKNTDYLPTVFLHATWTQEDGTVTLAGTRMPNTIGNCNATVIMVVGAAVGRIFVPEFQGGLDSNLTGGI